MDSLIQEIAANAADYAVAKYGLHLTGSRQQRLWKRYHDSALAALMAFAEMHGARAVRARAITSQN